MHFPTSLSCTYGQLLLSSLEIAEVANKLTTSLFGLGGWRAGVNLAIIVDGICLWGRHTPTPVLSQMAKAVPRETGVKESKL